MEVRTCGQNKRTMYTGRLDFCPRMVVDQSTLETSRRMRGRNHILLPKRDAEVELV